MAIRGRAVRRFIPGIAGVLTVWSVVLLGPAQAAEPALQEFAIPSGAEASQISRGPDGNVWFTEPTANKVARITPGGNVTEFTLPVPGSHPCGITTGPDGNLWFTEAGRPVIGRITPGGVITEFAGASPGRAPLPLGCDIVTGADGNLWVAHLRDLAPGQVERVSTAGDVDDFPSFGTAFSGMPEHITKGGDGALWVSQAYAPRLGRISTGGSITELALPAGGYRDIASGPDGNLWLVGSMQEGSEGRILRVTPGGGVTEFEVPGSPCTGCLAPSLPVAITSGPLGRLWFLDDARSRVGSITTGGIITTFDLPSSNRRLADITAGPDGNLWFIQNGSHTIGRLAPASVGNTSTAVATPAGPDVTTPTTLPAGVPAPTRPGADGPGATASAPDPGGVPTNPGQGDSAAPTVPSNEPGILRAAATRNGAVSGAAAAGADGLRTDALPLPVSALAIVAVVGDILMLAFARRRSTT